MEEQVLDIVSTITGFKVVSTQTSLEELGLDSIDVISVWEKLEEVYKKEFFVESTDTVEDLLRMIKN
jgi:acyl carrier protein